MQFNQALDSLIAETLTVAQWAFEVVLLVSGALVGVLVIKKIFF